MLALEGGPHGIRSNIVNPDAVFRDSKLWSEDVRRERARAQGISVDDLEDFYRKRNILARPILPEDVAEAVLFLASDRSAKTTGCTITVDGGVKDAFPARAMRRAHLSIGGGRRGPLRNLPQRSIARAKPALEAHDSTLRADVLLGSPSSVVDDQVGVSRVRAPALPAQSLGGGFGRGAKPPSE